ncbi:D-alanyl-D-alanine carboxypeptidase [Francisella halioticida]|uniref:D-alanyl-D-alanine carboxypeptidase/D-alanyl-D-alanine endopeptidase n=1 Tax=Francisella halioticida TaxID=549298 RepID=UPI001AFB2C08|nr:D-alanyl-D-alanine carboxypeptidase/D-alanyl-D-alanine-endopeptidase [Francisella halioticida]BCD90412.1 D-alanyl-D-alanine carboxypeptidase [Francisella halioticida]
MHKKTKFLIILFVFIVFISNTFAAGTRSEIQYLVKKYGLTNANFAIAAQRTMTGKELYSYAKNRAMKPASNNKVFTMVAALFTLPSNFRFTTSIDYPSSRLKNHILYSDMYIKFSGDPSLTGTQLATLIKNIKMQKGIKQITGDIYLVGVLSGPYIPQGWSKEDSSFCYGAPASSFTMNRNCTVIKLAKNPNSLSTKVIKLSNASNIFIDNSAKYTSTSKATLIYMDNDNTIHISGYLSRTAEKMFELSIKNPALKTLDTVKDFLNNNGIKHGNVSIASKVPKGYPPQITTSSATIGYIIDETLKHSDNLYAETILDTVALKKTGVGSTKSGTEAVQNIIYSKLGLNTSALTMYDGSGLSQLDRVSPNFMVNFLTKTFNSPIGKKLYNYLPASGMNGTIAYRMGGKLLGRVHAKTGTLSGVSTLSGYLLTAKNHRITFSIMLNDLKRSDRYNACRFQDKVVGVFYRYL